MSYKAVFNKNNASVEIITNNAKRMRYLALGYGVKTIIAAPSGNVIKLREKEVIMIISNTEF